MCVKYEHFYYFVLIPFSPVLDSRDFIVSVWRSIRDSQYANHDCLHKDT